jgi:hypothetical protein
MIWPHGAWRSLAARLLWEQEVGGSNPPAPMPVVWRFGQGRLWVRARRLMLRMALPLAVIGALAIAAPAAANEDYSYIVKGTRCVSHDGGQTVAARTRWRFNFGRS